MKKYIAPKWKVVELDALDSIPLVTSPQDKKPTYDDPLNQFSKKANFIVDDDEEEGL